MNRKERREALVPTRIHTKFLYQEHDKLPVEIKEESDGRSIAIIQLEWYASTKVKDWSGDVVTPEGIDLSRFENGNAPLKAMHWRGVISNVGVILEARKDTDWLYIRAEARLDVTKDNNWRPINDHDYVLYDRLMNRTINWFSIWFHNIKERYDREVEANVIETMTLHEISIVDVPDNPLTIIKMLEILHENEDGVLNSTTNMNEKKKTHENEDVKEVTEEVTEEEETTEENNEEQATVEEENTENANQADESGEKDLMWENSLDDMLKEKVKDQLWVERWVYIVDVFKKEFVYNHYYYEWETFVDKYYRNTYMVNWEEVSIGDTATEVEAKTYWVDKAKFLRELDGQDSKDSWNATAEESENDENGDEGAESEEKSLETKSKELEEKSQQVEALTKELESTEVMLKEAQEIAQGVIVKYKALEEVNQELNEEIKELKKAKQEHGMALTGDSEGGENKQGNVKKALQDWFKQLS